MLGTMYLKTTCSRAWRSWRTRSPPLGGAAEAPPEAELQDMLAEDQEDLRANQFLNMGHRFMLAGENMDAPELLGQRSQASKLGECSD